MDELRAFFLESLLKSWKLRGINANVGLDGALTPANVRMNGSIRPPKGWLRWLRFLEGKTQELGN